MQLWISLVFCLAGSLLFVLRLRAARKQGEAPESGLAGRVSIIIPARNEAHNLPTLLASLCALEPAPLEIIVVDDHSSDGTGALARAAGARVLTPPPLPAGWLGKTWACWAGAQAAHGDFLLFTDADTWHAPRSLADSVDRLVHARAGLLSLIPTHRVEAVWEHFQGIFQLLLLIATRAGTGQASRQGRSFAIGQYMLFRRDVYAAIGGHTSVPMRLAEDMALAREVRAAGHRALVAFAPNALRVRMYPEGFRAFFAGWRRSFRDGMMSAGLPAVLELTAVFGWLLGVPLWCLTALVQGQLALAAGWALVALLSALIIGREQRHYGDFGALSALSYPLFACVFAAVSLASYGDALRGAPVTWRGRIIQLAR